MEKRIIQAFPLVSLLLRFLQQKFFSTDGKHTLTKDSLDFAFLASVFLTHSPLLIEYEVRCMINSSQNKKSWNETIDEIFKKLTS